MIWIEEFTQGEEERTGNDFFITGDEENHEPEIWNQIIAQMMGWA